MRILIIAALALACTACNSMAPKKTDKEALPTGLPAQQKPGGNVHVALLKEFYTQYITENANIPPRLAAIKAIESKYVTAALLRKLDEADLDYDPFLNAQDCDVAWIKTLEFTPVQGNSDAYKVCYKYGDSQNSCITLFLVSENGALKINDIDNLSQ